MKTYANQAYLTLSKEEIIIGMTGGLTPESIIEMIRKRKRWLTWEKRINPSTGKAKMFIIVTDPYKLDRTTGEPRIRLVIDEIRKENIDIQVKLWDDIEFIPYCEEMVFDYDKLPEMTEGKNTIVAEDDGIPRVHHVPKEPDWLQKDVDERIEDMAAHRERHFQDIPVVTYHGSDPAKTIEKLKEYENPKKGVTDAESRNQDSLVVNIMGILSDIRKVSTPAEVKELGDDLYGAIKDIYDYNLMRVIA